MDLGIAAKALATALVTTAVVTFSTLSLAQEGTAAKPLRVMLIPADGGTEDGTKADYVPIFNAVSKMTGIHFDIKVGQSYGAVVEAMCNRVADVAFFGPVSYVQAHKRGCANLLAVAVEKGESVYYAGMFVNADSPMKRLDDVKAKRVAFGDVNSASSFTFQIAMLLEQKIDPVKDLAMIQMTGSHANSLKALQQGLVDVASASFDSYEKAVKQGSIDPAKVRVLAKSMPIPYPPLALHPQLPLDIQKKLKDAFNTVHKAPGVTPDMVRGYGGKKVDSYDANFSEDEFGIAAQKLAQVNDALKGEILAKAGKR